MGVQEADLGDVFFTVIVLGFLRGGCPRQGGNWRNVRIPREDWGTSRIFRRIRGITTTPEESYYSGEIFCINFWPFLLHKEWPRPVVSPRFWVMFFFLLLGRWDHQYCSLCWYFWPHTNLCNWIAN